MLPAEEQDKLRAEQAKLREEYGELAPALDAARLAAQDARAVVTGLEGPVQRARRELDDLLGRMAEAETALTEAEQAEVRANEQREQMEARDEQITNRLKELNRVLSAMPEKKPEPPPEAKTDLLAAAERFGQFSARDLAVVLKISPRAAKAAIEAHVQSGNFRDTGRKVMGQQMYEHVQAQRERKDEEVESFRLVRDFVCAQPEPFSPTAVSDATEVEGQELDDALQRLLTMGTIQYVGFDDLTLYEYVKPTEMGKAAERDIERAKAQRAPSGGVSAPVKGTGKDLRISDPDVRALVQQIQKAGGTVETGARGGHYLVSAPGSKRKIPISSTPSSRRSVLNDKARVRRELQLNI